MSTSKDQFLGIEEMLVNRNFAGAIAQIEEAKDDFYKEKEKVQYYLDIGMLYHYNGEWEKSNEALTAAEYAIEELFTESMSKAALSLLLNDNAKDYSGEDYEDIYLNVIKSLNYFHLGLYEDAMVEVRRVNIKLGMLEDKYRELAAEYNKSEEAEADLNIGENTFHNSALARYLSMLLYRADGEWDDAEIDKNYLIDAFQMQAHLYDFPVPILDNYLEPSENAKVNFICFTGRGPDKIAKTLYVDTNFGVAVIVAAEENPEFDQEISDWAIIPIPGVAAGYHFKFQLPVINKLGSDIARVEISFSNGARQDLEKIESLENVAVETFNIKKPLIYVKTIIRATIKGILGEAAKDGIDKSVDNPIAALFLGIATDVAIDATENADLRISRFFPANSYVGEIEVPPGIYNVQVNYYAANGALIFTDNIVQVEFQAGQINLVESFSLN